MLNKAGTSECHELESDLFLKALHEQYGEEMIGRQIEAECN